MTTHESAKAPAALLGELFRAIRRRVKQGFGDPAPKSPASRPTTTINELTAGDRDRLDRFIRSWPGPSNEGMVSA